MASLVRSCAPAPIFPARAAQFIPLALGCLSDGQAVHIEDKEEEEEKQQQPQPQPTSTSTRNQRPSTTISPASPVETELTGKRQIRLWSKWMEKTSLETYPTEKPPGNGPGGPKRNFHLKQPGQLIVNS